MYDKTWDASLDPLREKHAPEISIPGFEQTVPMLRLLKYEKAPQLLVVQHRRDALQEVCLVRYAVSTSWIAGWLDVCYIRALDLGLFRCSDILDSRHRESQITQLRLPR